METQIKVAFENLKADDTKIAKTTLRKLIAKSVNDNTELDKVLLESIFLHFGYQKTNVEGIYKISRGIVFFEPTLLEMAKIICKELSSQKVCIDSLVENISVTVEMYMQGSQRDREINELDGRLILKKIKHPRNTGTRFNDVDIKVVIANYKKACDLAWFEDW